MLLTVHTKRLSTRSPPQWHHSTAHYVEMTAKSLREWWARTGSNGRPLRCQRRCASWNRRNSGLSPGRRMLFSEVCSRFGHGLRFGHDRGNYVNRGFSYE